MYASTLRDAADTLTEKVSGLAHTVAEVTPEVTGKVGEKALRLAALTPWVDEPAKRSGLRQWVVGLIVLAVVGAIAWKVASRGQASSASSDAGEQRAPDGRRITAVAN